MTLAERYPRTAISHDWLTIPGGSEKVVLALLGLLPHARVLTSIYDPEPWPPALSGARVEASFLDRIPGARRHYKLLLPLMDPAFRRFDLRDLDLVVSSNHACAKNVRARRGGDGPVHVCYCHTPMRYAWEPGFLAGERMSAPVRAGVTAALPYLRATDRRGARGVDHFVANSTVVRDRIAAVYGREATVVHPPVDVDRFLRQARADGGDDAPYLYFGRLVPYKRADVAVAAASRAGRRLVVAGTGRDLARIRAMAPAGTEFLGHVPDAAVPALFARCRALLFPGEEDFGIVSVEAQAAGLPVIGNRAGGVRDSVVDGRTGVLYDDGGVDGLVAAIERFEALTLDDADLRAHARRFAPERFAAAMTQVLLDAGR